MSHKTIYAESKGKPLHYHSQQATMEHSFSKINSTNLNCNIQDSVRRSKESFKVAIITNLYDHGFQKGE